MELRANVRSSVTGGIAAYKAAELVRLLGKQAPTCQVAMTEGDPLRDRHHLPGALRRATS